jgi:hypothetical protein
MEKDILGLPERLLNERLNEALFIMLRKIALQAILIRETMHDSDPLKLDLTVFDTCVRSHYTELPQPAVGW